MHTISKSVTVIYRRDEFRAFEWDVVKMNESALVLTPYVLADLQGQGSQIEQVTIKHVKTGEIRQVEID